jgi:Protein of unknown function (DUF1214)
MNKPPLSADLRKAWSELRQAVDDAEQMVLSACEGADDLDQAEGYRFATRILRTALELFVEDSPARDVHFIPLIAPTRKGLGDNPDVLYEIAPLAAEHAYRIGGRRGDAVFLSLCFYASTTPGEMPRWVFANLTDADMTFDAGGRYQLLVSRDRESKPDVLLPAEPALVIVRRYFRDRYTADTGEVSIEYEGAMPEHSPLAAHTLAERLRAAARFMRSVVEGPERLVRTFGANPNALFAPPPQASVSYPAEAPNESIKFYYPTPDAAYPCGWFRLAPGEALVIRVRPPRSRYWSIHLMNRWFESLDDRITRRAVNDANAVLDSDGSCRVVISQADPGVPNWLWTAGHRDGFVLFRWLMAQAAPTPVCEVLPLDRIARS